MHINGVNYEFKFDDTSVSSDLFITDRSFNKTDLGLSRVWINVWEFNHSMEAVHANSKGSTDSRWDFDKLPGYTEVTLVPQGTNGSLAILGNGWLQIKINNRLQAVSGSDGKGGAVKTKALIAESNHDIFFDRTPDSETAWLRYRDKSGELSATVNGMVVVEKLDFENKDNNIANVFMKVKLNAVTVRMSSGERYIFSGQFSAIGKCE